MMTSQATKSRPGTNRPAAGHPAGGTPLVPGGGGPSGGGFAGGGHDDVQFGIEGDDILTGGNGNDAVTLTDLDPSADKLVISVEDNGLGAVTLAADPGGLGTQVLYRVDVVALINGKTPADLSGFLPQISVEKRIDLG